MAVFETRSEWKEGDPVIVERIEVRPWRLGGKPHQEFVAGGGANFNATGNTLIEIIYSINGVQFFYTRNFIHYMLFDFPIDKMREALEKFRAGEGETFGYGDMLPATAILLKRQKYDYDHLGEQRTHESYRLTISADISGGICMSDTGSRLINIEISLYQPEDGFAFMRQLIDEIAEVHQGKHPNPADLPPGSSQWHFPRQVNQGAYDQIAADYEERYFAEPLLREAFDEWLCHLPANGHILDVGCGHGQPVIAQLLEKGYHVTGADLSPKMLERARQQFPSVPFVNQLASEMTFESEFDAACSFSSLLYLDPIDLSHSLYRLQHALKPGGLLFLFAYDLHPGYRGNPYHVDLDQWMWGWSYGMEEAAQALEEHGFFKVLKARDVTTEKEKQERIDKWYSEALEQHESFREQYPHMQFPAPDRSQPPALSYKYVVLAQVQKE